MTRKKQKVANMIFFSLLVFGSVFLIVKNRYSKDLPLYIMFGVSTLYLSWALIYHKIDKSLTLPIFIEYLLTAILILIVLTGVII